MLAQAKAIRLTVTNLMGLVVFLGMLGWAGASRAVPLDVCNRNDQLTLFNLAQNIDITDVNPRFGIPPGSWISIFGSGFRNYLPSTQDVDIVVKYTSFIPNGNSGYSTQIDRISSWARVSDTEIVADVPKTVLQGNGVISIAAEAECTVASAGQLVTTTRSITFASFKPISYGARDLPVEPITDLKVTVLPRELRFDWSDVANERKYQAMWRPIGTTQWNSINWLGAPADLPENTSTVTFPRVNNRIRLEPPEAFEYAVFSRNYLSSRLSNVVTLDGRSGRIIINNSPPPLASTLCDGTVLATQIGAFFDQNGDGIVNGFEAFENLPFPRYPEVDINLPSGYWIHPGRLYASANAKRANLIVVAQYYSCSALQPQFVAVHLHVEFLKNRLITTPVLMLAGDEENEIMGPEPIRGIVMETDSFDGSLDAAALLNEDRAVGFAVGNVAWGSPGGTLYGTNIELEFDVPVDLR